MAQTFNADNVLSGTYGEVWLNGEYIAQATKFRAELTKNFEDVKLPRSLVVGKKLSGIETEGEITLSKVDSKIAKMEADALKNGKSLSHTIIGKLADPNGLGNERVVLYGVKFEKATLADWENGSLGEENYSFTFSDWDYLDSIN